MVISGLGLLREEEKAERLHDRLATLQSARRHVVLNLAGARQVNALMLGVFVKASQHANRLQRRLLFCSLDQDLLRVFTLSRLIDTLEIFETEELALASLMEKGQ